MATVLVSFIGIGQKPREGQKTSRTEYAKIKYDFKSENGFAEEVLENSIFGSVLLQHLKNMKRKVDRWLIMGTVNSIWCDLIEMFPQEKQEEILEREENLAVWNQIRDEIDFKSEAKLSGETLERWQKILTKNLQHTEVICRIVGTASTVDSQQMIFEALLKSVKIGNNVVFDVTHGLRNQPIITSFALMYLRNLRNVKNVEFYYGASELKGEVVKLNYCNEILEAIESAAIYKQTGNYRQTGKQLGISESFQNGLDYVAYTDETLKPQKDKAKILLSECRKANLNPIKKSLSDKLCEALAWANESSTALVWKKKAETAFQREQYFKAVAMLWESILIAECERFGVSNSSDHDEREKADKRLQKRLQDAGKRSYSKEKDDFWHLKNLRNTILHGTKTSDVKVQKAIDCFNDFENIFDEGTNLFDKILTRSHLKNSLIKFTDGKT